MTKHIAITVISVAAAFATIVATSGADQPYIPAPTAPTSDANAPGLTPPIAAATQIDTGEPADSTPAPPATMRTITGIVESLIDGDTKEILGITIFDETIGHDFMIEEDELEVELRKHIDNRVRASGTITPHESKLFSGMQLESFEIIRRQPPPESQHVKE